MGRADEPHIEEFLGAARKLLTAFLAHLEREDGPLFADLQRALPDEYGVLAQLDDVVANERKELLQDEELPDPVAEGLRQEVLADARTKPAAVAAVLVHNVLSTLEFRPEVQKDDEERLTDSLGDALIAQLDYDPREALAQADEP